ncbi:MAG TPA: pantoate--beta-alanine ligase [Burkholderiales bacterium]|nr:pantoate--beta-alanine ligase [Burkholderiales bacterium]
MQIISTISELRARLAGEASVGLVPTMGNLHAGHLSLMKIARAQAGCAVASIFVNRLQFGPNEDFDCYPRTFAEDCAKLEAAGIDVVFAPRENELYPQPQTMFVEPEAIASELEGRFRPGHLRGVATVVLKLFNAVRPHLAVFGKKDYQQLLLIGELVRQFNLPIEIVAGETIRESDGLALSSRNRYLSAAERAEATRLNRNLAMVCNAVAAGGDDIPVFEKRAHEDLKTHGWQVDYIAVRTAAGLRLPTEGDGELVVLGAARLGRTRLIDNVALTVR